MTPQRASLLVSSWRQDGYNLAEMLMRFYSRPLELPDGERIRELTPDGMIIRAEIYRVDEIEAMIATASYFANAE